MDDQKPPSVEFEETFSEAFLEEIQRALADAYDNAAEKHEPAVGSDAFTFGVTLYRFVWHQLRALAAKHPENIRVDKPGNADRMYIGEFVLGCYRVGSSAEADISCSFPSNDEGAVTTMIDPRQQMLPGFESKPTDFADNREYVIAHLGNHDEGLGAIYLCIPAGRFGQKVERWAYTYLVWKQSETMDQRPSATQALQPMPPAPPPENVDDFEVPRRRKRKTDDEPSTE